MLACAGPRGRMSLIAHAHAYSRRSSMRMWMLACFCADVSSMRHFRRVLRARHVCILLFLGATNIAHRWGWCLQAGAVEGHGDQHQEESSEDEVSAL